MVGTLALALLTGCSSGGTTQPGEIAPAYRERIDDALQNDPSELEIAVLSDQIVTDEEYAQAREAYKACIEASEYGLIVFLAPGQTEIEQPAGFADAMGGQDAADEAVNKVSRDCASHTVRNIEPIYLGMRDNPEGLGGTELIRRCFERHGIEDGKGLPDDEFHALIFEDENYLTANPDSQTCVGDPFTQ